MYMISETVNAIANYKSYRTGAHIQCMDICMPMDMHIPHDVNDAHENEGDVLDMDDSIDHETFKTIQDVEICSRYGDRDNLVMTVRVSIYSDYDDYYDDHNDYYDDHNDYFNIRKLVDKYYGKNQNDSNQSNAVEKCKHMEL
eukprot:5496_1